MMFTFSNDGKFLKSTNYWESEHAAKGLLYVSGNAGAWRLLVPKASEALIPEMKTGKSVTMEKSMVQKNSIDVVFEDGTSSPFFVSIMRLQVDRAFANGATQLLVYTEAGLQLSLPCKISV